MSIMITGGAGFVASTLVGRLLAAGERVVAIDNLCRGSLRNLTEYAAHPNLEFLELDVCDLPRLRAAVKRSCVTEQITEVWHLAANSDIPAGVEDPDVDLQNTFITTFNTLLVMREYRIPSLLFSSSSAIYGNHGEEILRETSGPLFPISNYGAMKLASEAQISAAAEHFLDRAVIFRFPNVVGVPATHGVILDLIRKLKLDPAVLHVLGNGSQQKSYLHVTDLVDAMLFVRERAPSGIDVFNVGPIDEGVRVSDIAAAVVAAVAPGARTVFGASDRGWVGDVPKFRYCVEKLTALGWVPSLGSAEAVRLAVREIAMQEGFVCARQ